MTYPSPPASGQWDPSFAPMSGYQTPPPRERPLSKAAVTSLVLGIIGGTVLAVVFGIVGLRAVAHGNRRGKGFAWAGIALSVLWIAAVIGLAAVHQSQQADRALDGSVQTAGKSDVLSLQKGDCLQDPSTTAEITDVDVLPCTQSHDAQVFAVLSVSEGDGSYDESRIKAEVEKSCTTSAQSAVDIGSATYDLGYFYPPAAGWKDGTRTAVCIVTSDTPLTRSLVIG